uniref:exodeoxyribonuclease III n=1 Tax=Esox lucius TaxID=8010 RepID=A0AAY5K7H6_ESOLU
MQTRSIKDMLNTFKVVTWNVNGLQEGLKKTVIYHLENRSADIVFLQELHFRAGQIEFLKRRWVGEAFEAVYTSRSRGVGILIDKRIPFKLVSQHSDPYGRYLIIKCELFRELYTLLSIYRPPAADMAFLKDIQIRLDSSQTGLIIMGGELNMLETFNFPVEFINMVPAPP